MAVPRYPVICYRPGCTREAAFKVAANWSDGITDELKTYYLACAECLAKLYTLAVAKRDSCRLAPGEVLEAPGVYELHHGERDKTLKRRPDLEQVLVSGEER
jgi:hypothetical protein